MATVPQESGLSLLSRLVVRPSVASCLGPHLPPLAPGCTTLTWGGDKDIIKDKAGQNQDSLCQPNDTLNNIRITSTQLFSITLLLPGLEKVRVSEETYRREQADWY